MAVPGNAWYNIGVDLNQEKCMASDVDVEYTGKRVFSDELPAPERVSVITLLQQYLSKLADRGYEVIPSTAGKFQGAFNVYRTCTTAKRLGEGLRGLTEIPENHLSQFAIDADDSKWESAVSEVAQELFEEWREKSGKAVNMIDGLELTFSGLSSTFNGFNLQRYYASRQANGACTTLNGSQLQHKIVPLESWFDQRIRNITTDQLLQLFSGDAERKLFMLWLGRIVAGNRNHVITEHFGKGLDTGCRILAILVGEAGNGKSFTLGILDETLAALGFDTSSLPELNSRFGWDKATASDLSTCSDLSADSFKKLVCDSVGTTKVLQMVTGDRVNADIKNVRAVELWSRAALGFATNEVPVEAQINPNEGMVSRTCLLSTVTKVELGQRFNTNPLNAKEAWENLLLSQGIEPTQEWLRTLMAYLVRKSLDYYLEVSGYEYRLGSLYKKDHKVSLEKYVEELKGQLKEKLECAHKYELPTAAIRALALAIVANKAIQADLDDLKKVPWSWRLVQLTWESYKSSMTFGVEKADYLLPSMHRGYQGRLKVIDNAVRECIASSKEPNAKHMDLLSYFNTDSGIGYPRRVSAYSKLWDTKLGDLEYYIEQVALDVQNGIIPKQLVVNAKAWYASFIMNDW